MADPTDVIRTIRRIVLDVIDDQKRDTSTELAEVFSVTATGARVTFDGESTPSQKHYRYLRDNAPSVGDRVVLHKVGSSKVILGALS